MLQKWSAGYKRIIVDTILCIIIITNDINSESMEFIFDATGTLILYTIVRLQHSTSSSSNMLLQENFVPLVQSNNVIQRTKTEQGPSLMNYPQQSISLYNRPTEALLQINANNDIQILVEPTEP